MMFKKAITNSGRKILQAIKKISTARLAKKLELQQRLEEQRLRQIQETLLEQEANLTNWLLQKRFEEMESLSGSSTPSLDAKSVDTFVTYVADNLNAYEDCYLPYCCCQCDECDERDENQRNENLENEMMR